jgi:hypothetical protein
MDMGSIQIARRASVDGIPARNGIPVHGFPLCSAGVRQDRTSTLGCLRTEWEPLALAANPQDIHGSKQEVLWTLEYQTGWRQ